MKRISAVVLSFLILSAALFSANAAVYNGFETKEKVIFSDGTWEYAQVRTYGYEINKYLGNDADVDVPYVFAKQYVNSLGAHAFNINTNVTSVNTTYLIDTIGDYAFNGCSSLKTVKLYDSLTTLGVGCFYGDNALKNINIQNTSIAAVPAYCFAECGITRLPLPETCTSIGNYAFYNCSGLLRVDIPDSVTEIADTAFDGCDNLVIVCSADSYAAQYAEANGIDYALKDDFVMGDFNGDGNVTIRDVTFIQLYRVGLQDIDKFATARCDINGDGKVDIRDATYIQMYRAQLIDSLDNI
ncbi:MAG: leucine-rich repeat protein [Ruminococcus sp.]|nr:leucine-rich repeat protein [Ruminococcus sp.]